VPPERRTQADRRRDAERALLDAATRLFAQRGIDNTGLADIGAAAGYSRGLVNHHFGTKAALVERLAGDSQKSVVRTLPTDAQSDPVDVIVAIANAYLDTIADDSIDSRAFFVMWGASFPSDSPLKPVFVVDDMRFRAAIATLVRSGQDAGVVSPAADPQAFSVALVAMLRGIGGQYLVSPEAVDFASCRDVVVGFIRSIAPPAKTTTTSRTKRTKEPT